MTRDTHQSQAQSQVEASLNALASGISELLKLDVLQASTAGKAAISKIADGICLIANLHYGLSKAKRAFIVPSLYFSGKAASDLAAVDEYLFGNNFSEKVNAAQIIEKVANKMARKSHHSAILKTKPTVQQSAQKNQFYCILHTLSKNRRASPRRTSSTHRARRGSYQSKTSRRSRSRSQARRYSKIRRPLGFIFRPLEGTHFGSGSF